VFALSGTKQRVGELPVGKGPGATLPDEIEAKNIRPQPELFDDVSTEARAQTAGTGRDDDSIDRLRSQIGPTQSMASRLCGEARRMSRERVSRRPNYSDAANASQHSLLVKRRSGNAVPRAFKYIHHLRYVLTWP
jgi:hypothetical protein